MVVSTLTKETHTMKRILAIAALALVTAVPAHALTAGQESIVLNGIASHGSMVCNPDWLDRPGSYAILARAQKAAHANSKSVKALLMRGMIDFDNRVKEQGKASVCRTLDQMINVMGG